MRMTLAATSGPVLTAAKLESANGYSCRVLAGAGALDQCGDAVRRLAGQAPGAIVFQTESFLRVWARAYVGRGDGDDLTTVMVYRGETLAGIVPVEITSRGLVTTARLAGAPVGQYDDVLIDPAADPADVVEAALAALRRDRGVDLLLLTRVRSDGALARGCRRFVELGPPEEAPYADLGEAGADAFMASLKGRVRRQQSKRKRQLAELGMCEYAQAAGPEEAAQWMREALALKREWLRRSGRLSQAFMDRQTADHLIAAAREGAGGPIAPVEPGRSRLVMSRLTVAGRTAALEVGFLCRDAYHFYLGTFAPEFAPYGAGNVLTENVVRACAEGGMRRYDMLAPDSRNKREWANGSVAVKDMVLPLSAPGRLYALVVHRTLRPALRRAFYALPENLRARIAGRLLAVW
jgi:CelD/BcsL family acetyltransferase involved in cellulose biosynthesis